MDMDEAIFNEMENEPTDENKNGNINLKKSDGPIIKSKYGNISLLKIVYFCSDKNENKDESNEVIKQIVANGTDREVSHMEDICFSNAFVGGNPCALRPYEPRICLRKYTSLIVSTFNEDNWNKLFEECSFLVVDANCDEDLLKMLSERITSCSDFYPYLFFVDRSKGENGFVNSISNSGCSINFFSMKAKDVVGGVADIVGELDEHWEEGKPVYKKHKGKFVIGGFVSLLTLEELWRHGFFSKNGTNEKSQNSENLKDLKNETKSQKGKNANSAAN